MSRGGDLLRLQEVDTRLRHDTTRLADIEAQIAGDPGAGAAQTRGAAAAP